MATPINEHKLRKGTRAILRRVEAGESFLISRRKKRIGVLSPVNPRYFVDSEMLLKAFANAPSVDRAALNEDLDAVADPSIQKN